MRVGIFAKTFVRPTVESALDAVVKHGVDCIQFNFACAGLPSMPPAIENPLADRIGKAVQERRLQMAAVSGTFNMIHPDLNQREDGFRRLEVIAAYCKTIGTNLITLCTGTRDANDMWRSHPENDSADAWKDLRTGLDRALRIADKHDVFLGIEPELANVVNSAPKARRLLDEVKNRRIRIVMDGANLLQPSELPAATRIWQEAFDLLGNDITLAHAKDLTAKGAFAAAGAGDLDWDLYIRLLRAANFRGPIILHGLDETEVDGAIRFIKAKVGQSDSTPSLKGRL